jgi:hypothetical protein
MRALRPSSRTAGRKREVGLLWLNVVTPSVEKALRIMGVLVVNRAQIKIRPRKMPVNHVGVIRQAAVEGPETAGVKDRSFHKSATQIHPSIISRPGNASSTALMTPHSGRWA